MSAPIHQTMLMERTLHEFTDEHGVEYLTFVGVNGERLTLPAMSDGVLSGYDGTDKVTVRIEPGSHVGDLSRRAGRPS